MTALLKAHDEPTRTCRSVRDTIYRGRAMRHACAKLPYIYVYIGLRCCHPVEGGGDCATRFFHGRGRSTRYIATEGRRAWVSRLDASPVRILLGGVAWDADFGGGNGGGEKLEFGIQEGNLVLMCCMMDMWWVRLAARVWRYLNFSTYVPASGCIYRYILCKVYTALVMFWYRLIHNLFLQKIVCFHF